jgi:pimeloyl-ACP methyl ester carboxylesterase
MADNSREWHEETIKVDGTNLRVVKGGTGNPLLILHDELGFPGWLGWNSALAKTRTLLVPLHPGFGATERAEWITNIRDMAGFYARYLKEQKLAPIDVIGFSLGGWIAAEMAANNPSQFRKMVLVAPEGIRPPEGEGYITDFFQVMAPQHFAATMYKPAEVPELAKLYGGQGPEAFELWEDARAQTARIAWQPFLFNPSLPHLLGVAAGLPTTLIWGREDNIVPLASAHAYHQSIKGSTLKIFDQCGHRPEVEKSAQFISEVTNFLS